MKKNKRRVPLAPPSGPGIERRVQSMAETSILGEIEHIVECALAEDARTVTLGQMVFFSTTTRDAWMLDAEDGSAAPLCRGGEILVSPLIDETADRFTVCWPADFEIVGDSFVTRDRETGRSVRVIGYPVAEISRALEDAKGAAGAGPGHI